MAVFSRKEKKNIDLYTQLQLGSSTKKKNNTKTNPHNNAFNVVKVTVISVILGLTSYIS